MEKALRLPRLARLKRLAADIRSFPVSGEGIIQSAGRLDYGEEVLSFVRLFSDKIVFKSRTDFVDHCSLLEKLLKEEWRAEPEQLRSPQG